MAKNNTAYIRQLATSTDLIADKRPLRMFEIYNIVYDVLTCAKVTTDHEAKLKTALNGLKELGFNGVSTKWFYYAYLTQKEDANGDRIIRGLTQEGFISDNVKHNIQQRLGRLLRRLKLGSRDTFYISHTLGRRDQRIHLNTHELKVFDL